MSKKTLNKFSIKELQREITRRNQGRLESLNQKKADIEDEIRSISGNVVALDTINKARTIVTKNNASNTVKHKVKKAAATKKRITDTVPLITRIMKFASDGLPHTPTEFLAAAVKDGWKTSANKPYHIVAAKLATITKKNIMQRVAKGSYQLVKTDNPVVDNNVPDQNN